MILKKESCVEDIVNSMNIMCILKDKDKRLAVGTTSGSIIIYNTSFSSLYKRSFHKCLEIKYAHDRMMNALIDINSITSLCALRNGNLISSSLFEKVLKIWRINKKCYSHIDRT